MKNKSESESENKTKIQPSKSLKSSLTESKSIRHRKAGLKNASDRTIDNINAERYRDFIENIQDGCFELDLAGNFTFFNSSICRILGYSREEMMGMNYRQYTDKEISKKAVKVYNKVFKTGNPVKKFCWQIKRKDNEKIYIEGSISLRKDSSGTPVGYIGIVNDITARKRAEKSLRESKKRFRTQYHGSPIPTFTWQKTGADYVLVECNHAAQTVTGENIKNYMNRTAQEIYRDQQDILQDMQRCFETKAVITKELRSRHFMPGRYVVATYAFVPDDLVMVHIEDITERKQAEESLRQSEELYTKLVNAIPDIVVRTDLEGNILFANDYTLLRTGYRREEIEGRNILRFIAPEDHERVIEDVQLMIERYRGPKEYKLILKDGSLIPIEVNGDVLRNEDGTPFELVDVCRDITERKHTEMILRENEERLRGITENIPGFIFRFHATDNGEYGLSYASGRLKDFFGEMGDLNELFPFFFSHVYDEDRDRFLKSIETAVKQEMPWDFIGRLQSESGEKIWFRGLSTPTRYENQLVFDGLLLDITEQKNMEEALRQSEEKYRNILENIQEGYFEVDLAGNFTFFNDSMCRLYDYSSKEMKGMNYRRYTDDENAKLIFQAFHRVYKKNESIRELSWRVITKDGQTKYVEASVALIKDSSGKATGFKGIVRDVTERKRLEQELKNMATHDVLTGLPNRLMFSQLLNHALQTARRYKRQFAVFFIDLDRFKIINDTMGHEAGDQLLKEIANRFRQSLRAVDIVSRLGGDEFVILIEDVSKPDQIAALAQKMLAAALKPVKILGKECRVTASIGISVYPMDGEDDQTLIKNADAAMYFAKEEGKNNYQFYSKKIKTLSTERMSIETNLRLALDRKEFFLDYQARMDFKTGMITGVEALLRWENPYLGSVTPTQFIPIAEESGLILPIGRWVLKTACTQNVLWQSLGLPHVIISVNLSLRQMMDEHFVEELKAILVETGMQPNYLELEISESMLMHDPSRMIAILTKIKKMGIRIAIDNFGTGYSSLAQIKNFPVDTLKVDRSFVRNITQDEDTSIIESIINIGKHLSLTVVAEGVETQAQDDFLRKLICDEMQGYYFSKPVSPDQFANLLRKYNITS